MAQFTEEQKLIIKHREGNALCLAGAGTGKTTTLVGVYQAQARLVPEQSIQVLMFNKTICDDFRSKLLDKGYNPHRTVKTYHGFCQELLTRQGLGPKLVFEPMRRTQLIRTVLQKMANNCRLPTTKRLLKKPKTVAVLESFISLVKAIGLNEDEVFEAQNYGEEYDFLLDAYKVVEQERRRSGILFFDDWLIESVKLLAEDSELRSRVQQSIQLVIVDEFQDTNPVQLKLLKLIVADGARIMAVGDINQCIYKWRGSEPSIMLRFAQEFPPCTTYKLSHTFRFGHSLAIAADHLISNNKERFKDFCTVPAPSVEDTHIEHIKTSTIASHVVKAVKSQIEEGCESGEIAVLVRRWSQAMLIELAFIKANVPYMAPEGSTLAKSREVKLLLQLMNLVIRWHEQQKIDSHILQELFSYPHCYLRGEILQPLCRALASVPPTNWVREIDKFATANKRKDQNFDNAIERVTLIRSLLKKDMKARQIFEEYRSGSDLDYWLRKSEATEGDVEESLDKLNALTAVLKGLNYDCNQAKDFFESTQQRAAQSSRKSDGVRLTTIFRAKGCEYNNVHLPFWDRGIFPTEAKFDTGQGPDYEEERRVAYVAVTRAKQRAKIYTGDSPSPFVSESYLPLAHSFGPSLYKDQNLPHFETEALELYLTQLNRINDCAEAPKKPLNTRLRDKKSSRSTEEGVAAVGDRVRHIQGDKGTITNISGPKFTVKYDSNKSHQYQMAMFSRFFDLIG